MVPAKTMLIKVKVKGHRSRIKNIWDQPLCHDFWYRTEQNIYFIHSRSTFKDM